MRVDEERRVVDGARQELALLVDQVLGVAVVTHRDRRVEPRRPRDQVGAKENALALAGGAAEQEARRVAVALDEIEAVAERRARFRWAADHAQAAGGLEQRGKLGNERGAVTRVRLFRALE